MFVESSRSAAASFDFFRQFACLFSELDACTTYRYCSLLSRLNGGSEDDKPVLSKAVQEMSGKCNLVFSQYVFAGFPGLCQHDRQWLPEHWKIP